jgi:sugar lactone lactonase YvrE
VVVGFIETALEPDHLLDDLGHALLVPRSDEARCVLDAQAGLAEGPHWWAEKGVFLWVDIEASRVGLFDPVARSNRFLDLPSHVGAVVPMSAGDLLPRRPRGLCDSILIAEL